MGREERLPKKDASSKPQAASSKRQAASS